MQGRELALKILKVRDAIKDVGSPSGVPSRENWEDLVDEAEKFVADWAKGAQR